jgi:serine/threonine protein phosphatase 1
MARVPENHRVYAIGDIHGHADLAARMIDLIEKDIESSGRDLSCRIVGLGDYVDRGPDSAALIELLAGLEADDRRSFTWLKGNHEEMFLSFIDAPEEYGPGWVDFGGMMTLLSYGARFPEPVRRADFRRLRDALAARLPLPHLMFLQRLEISFTVGDFFFCHAGARPGIPLAQQSERDLLWIRQYAPDDDPAFDKVVVHGHTPVASPEIRSHRINIDTGAFATGTLTCIAIDESARRILQVTSGMANAHWQLQDS